MKKMIYLDNASTTPVRREVIEVMMSFWSINFGNPSSITKIGVLAKQEIEKARTVIATYLSRLPKEIIFTSGGTESNNLAIFGVVKSLANKGIKISNMHFISTNIEHSSITECFNELEKQGATVDYLKVKETGIIDSRDLRKMIKPNTVLISIGYANNEIGTIQPIREISKEVRYARKTNKIIIDKNEEEMGLYPYFHTDASQAGLYLNLNINELGVDLMTLDAQKIYGPKGVGILFKKTNVKFSPIILGGGQEGGLRSGTENVPLIAGQAKAFELVRKSFERNAQKIKIIRDYFWQKIQKEIPEAILNGDLENRLPNNLNISIPGINSEFTVLCLDEEGIVCSTKSACNHDEDSSFVVRALGRDNVLAKSSLRFTLSENINKKNIDYVVSKLKNVIKKQLKQNFN